MNKNKKLLLSLVSSFGLFILAFCFYLWIDKIDYDNLCSYDIWQITDSLNGKNSILDISGAGFLLPLDAALGHDSYYVYADYELNKQIIIRMDEYTYRDCKIYGFDSTFAQCYLRGVAFNIDEKLKQDFLSFVKQEEFTFAINNQDVNLHTVYLDTMVPAVERETKTQRILFFVFLTLGILLFGGSIILLIVNNFAKIKANKDNILKWLFRISFMPIGIIILISIISIFEGVNFFGTVYGMEAFLLCFFILGIIFCVIPVLPLAFIYQVVYVVLYLRKRNNGK